MSNNMWRDSLGNPCSVADATQGIINGDVADTSSPVTHEESRFVGSESALQKLGSFYEILPQSALGGFIEQEHSLLAALSDALDAPAAPVIP